MIKRGFTVLISALLAMLCLPALAAVDMTSSGALTFSVGLNGNFEFFTTNTQKDYSTGELYITCPCGEAHDADDLKTLTYSLIPAADCPYTMVIDNASAPRVHTWTDDNGRSVAQFTVGFFIDCAAKEALPLKAGAYPFTVVASASCACGNSGTATTVIEMVVSDGAASMPTHFGSTISDLLSAIHYQPDLVYQYDDMCDGVWFIQAALSDLGVYDGSRTGHYGFLTRDAVAHFQRMQGLPASGKCDAKTMARLFRLYLGEVETTYAPGYLNLGWNEDAQKITELLNAIDGPVQLIDLWTDVPLSVSIGAEENHLDAWPTSDEAGARALCKIYAAPSVSSIGGDQFRPALLVIPSGGETVQVVCAMQVRPSEHGVDSICLFLSTSNVHGGNSAASHHQDAYATAVNLMARKAGRTLGTGTIVSGGSAFNSMPPVEAPTLVLPNGSVQNASALLKYDQSDSANGAITYNVHMADLKGEEVELVKTSTLCFPYPEGLDQNSAHKYRIIIHHKISGKQTEVFKSEDGDIDFTPQGLCIRVSSFSPFEITWEESVMPDGAALPETGDGSPPLAFPLLAAAASCFGLCLIGKRRLG